jgi:peptidoglycan/xylan/chitin deacetylase (PgdA/CDA1 family)
LTYLDSRNVNVTFYINAANNPYGNAGVSSHPYFSTIQRMMAEGHQIASHTYSHEDLTLIGHDGRLEQMYHNEKAFGEIIGVIPTYMRPPYLSCDGDCQNDMAALGYHVTEINLETNDWQGDYDVSEAMFLEGVTVKPKPVGGYIALAHDIHALTVSRLTPFMINQLLANGYKTATVGECLGSKSLLLSSECVHDGSQGADLGYISRRSTRQLVS